MKRLSYIIWLLCVVGCQHSLWAQTFRTDMLKKAAEALAIGSQCAALPSGQTTNLVTADGLSVSVRTSDQQTVEHIGIPLFSPEMRMLMPSPVYDFLEFAVLNWKYKVSPNMLYLSKVIFRKGNWSILTTGRLSECECSITNQDDRLYIVTWQRDGEDVAVVGIPIEYELLNNDSRRNIERNFIHELSAHEKRQPDRQPKLVTEEDLKIYGTEGLFVVQGASYILPDLNQNVYYVLKTIFEQVDTVIRNKPVTMTLEDVVPAIVIDQEHPAETLANLLMGDAPEVPDVTLNLDFHMSDYHRQQMSLPLSQLKDYCHRQGDLLYFASSGTSDTTTRGMLMVSNIARGYNHLFSISADISQLTSAQPRIQAAAYLFIPPIDQSHLFGKMPTRKSGAKIN